MLGTRVPAVHRRRALVDLQGQRAAGEEGGEADDGERVVADAPHLLEDLAEVLGGGEALDHGVLEEQADAANFRQEGKHGTADGLERVQAAGSESSSE